MVRDGSHFMLFFDMISIRTAKTLFDSGFFIFSIFFSLLKDLKDAIVKGLGFPSEDLKVSGFDVRDALVGHSVAYEFDVEIDKKVLPIKLLEDVNRWEYVDLPIFRVAEGNENVLVPRKSEKGLPVLAPFQLAGPMELWIQDAKDMRISLPVRFF